MSDQRRIERWLVIERDGSVLTWGTREAAAQAMADRLKELTDRAEKAEVIVRARDAEIEVLRAFLKQFEDGGMSGREVREAKADERARYERETAARLLAGPCSTIEAAMSKARQLADACFGAKEAKG